MTPPACEDCVSGHGAQEECASTSAGAGAGLGDRECEGLDDMPMDASGAPSAPVSGDVVRIGDLLVDVDVLEARTYNEPG